MDEGLLKSRRNLLFISVVLILYDFADVSIGQISILGTNLIVGNPDVLYTFAWILWGYLLLRYLQHLAVKPDLDIKSEFSAKVSSVANPAIEKIVSTFESSRQYSNYGYAFLHREGLTWSNKLIYYDPVKGKQVRVGSVKVPWSLLIKAWCIAAAHICFFRPRVTDYILPLLTAAGAPLVTLYT